LIVLPDILTTRSLEIGRARLGRALLEGFKKDLAFRHGLHRFGCAG
jgi:hypothetical protein